LVNRKRLQLDQQPVTVKQYVHRKLEGLDLRQQAPLNALNTEDAASNTALQAITAAITAAATPPASQTAQARKQ
jgi:hypothetical protein